MSNWQIKRLGPDDIGLFRQMNGLFAEVFEDETTYLATPPSDRYVRELLAKETVHALMAIEAGAVIGALVAYELSKFESERAEVYIYDLAVSAAQRRKGIATELIGQLCDIASQRGAWVVYVQADYVDEPAVALYTKLGTREDVMHFDIPVRPAPAGRASGAGRPY
ncbi:AAC(3)-I family aminoglycoside N-acetyltransferase [Devosia sp. XK-2]|uniref:AAC(3)-I family aminoglycoside N-acetyltransferase n=1 Tax=Devosia sp. XK-2 TaxID=3126689 RepID=UPI0030CD1C40